MVTPPSFPVRAFLIWIAVVADLGGTTGLLMASVPQTLKVVVVGIEVLGFYTIVVFHLGRKSQWARGTAQTTAPLEPDR